MKRFVSILIAVALLVPVLSSGLNTSAQQATTSPLQTYSVEQSSEIVQEQNFVRNKPANVNIGASPQAKAAWEGMTIEEQNAVEERFNSIVGAEMYKSDPMKRAQNTASDATTLRFLNASGENVLLNADEQEASKLGVRSMSCFGCSEQTAMTYSATTSGGPSIDYFTTSHAAIEEGTEATTISWNVSNAAEAASIYLEGPNANREEAASKSITTTFSPAGMYVYTLRVTPRSPNFPTIQRQIIINVLSAGTPKPTPTPTPVPPGGPSIDYFTTSHAAIEEGTEATTISWNVSNAAEAASIYLEGPNANREEAASKSITTTFSPAGTYIYTLRVTPRSSTFPVVQRQIAISVVPSGHLLTSAPTPTPTPTLLTKRTRRAVADADADADALPDSFEEQLSDAFTPFYHVSAGEPDNFATFVNDSQRQAVLERFGPNPLSHFRVQPLGFAYDSQGQLLSVARIDYLTLWDEDSGLAGGLSCSVSLFGLSFLLDGALPHELDNERSAVLVAAPASGSAFNRDPNAYKAYSFFTTAHENVLFFDQSRYANFYDNPVPANRHIVLYLSRSKHGVYTGNPDRFPFTDPFLINAVYQEIEFRYYYGYINIYDYYALLYTANGFFFGCIVERFSDQGGRFADRRINVGEPETPINSSNFIKTDELRRKLTTPLWIIRNS